MEMFFSSNLKKLRNDYNVSQEELGKAINYSSKNISKWETEKAIPSIEIIKAISEFFENIPIEDLMYKNLVLNEFNTIKDVEYAKQTLIDLSNRQTRDEQILSMLQGTKKQDPRTV